MSLVILSILAACNQQHINGREKIPETTLKETTIEEVYPSESSNRISVNSGDNEVTMHIDELSVRVKHGSFDTTYVIHERYYGERFPQVNFEFSSESDVTVTQSDKVSNLNIGITGSNVTFKGPNPITAFRADSLYPSYPDNIEIHFEVSAPNLRLKPSSNIKYCLEVQSLEFESIDLENRETVQLVTYEKTNLKLKSIEYKSIYDDKNGFPEQPNIIVDVGFIHFYESPRTLVFDFPIVIHEYISSFLKSSFRFKDLKIADDSFYIAIVIEQYRYENECIQLVIESGDKFALPPSGKINILVKTPYSYSDKMFEFAKSTIDINFNLTFVDLSMHPVTSSCFVLKVVKSGNKYYLSFPNNIETRQDILYGDVPFAKTLDVVDFIQVDTLDSRKWPKGSFDLCKINELGVNIAKTPKEPLNLDILLEIDHPIEITMNLFGVDLEFNFSEAVIGHINKLFIGGYGLSRITNVRKVNFGSNIKLSIEDDIIFTDKAFDKMNLDNIKECSLSYEHILSMKERILKGKQISVYFGNCVGDFYVDYDTNSVKLTYNGRSDVINTIGKSIEFYYGSNGQPFMFHISSSSEEPTSNLVISCDHAAFEGDIPSNFFPLTKAREITCAASLPLATNNNNDVNVVTRFYVIDVLIKNGQEVKDSYAFQYSYTFPDNVEKINVQNKISIPSFNYKVNSKMGKDLDSTIDELKITGVSFDNIIKRDISINQEYLKSASTTEEYRRRISKESKFPQITPTKLVICSGSYVSMIDGDNKPSSVDFIFRPTSFPPVLDSNINFSDVSFKFSYQNQDEATYDKYDFFFNKFVPIAFLRESLCSDLDLSITNTDKMTVKCEDTFSGVTNDKKHAVLFVKLSTKFIDTPVYDTDGDPIVIPPYAGDDDEFGKDNSEKEDKPSLGKEAIIGISVGAVVVVIVVIIVVVVCLCKKDGGSSAGLGRGSMQL